MCSLCSYCPALPRITSQISTDHLAQFQGLSGTGASCPVHRDIPQSFNNCGPLLFVMHPPYQPGPLEGT